MDKIEILPPEWVHWQAERLRTMIASGMPRESAEIVSAAEARGRARIAQHVGFSAAAGAELVIVPDGRGGEKVSLRIDPRSVPEWRRKAAKVALNPDIHV